VTTIMRKAVLRSKLCQHVYLASTVAEQIEGNLLATLKSSFYYTKLLAEIWKQGIVKLTREFSCGVGQVSLKCGILQLLIKRSPLTCIYT